MERSLGVTADSVDLFALCCAHQRTSTEEKALNNQPAYQTG